LKIADGDDPHGAMVATMGMIVDRDETATVDHQAMYSPSRLPAVDLAVGVAVANCALDLQAIE